MNDRLHLPPTPPVADAPFHLHDAELVRLSIEDFGRRVRLSLVNSVDGGRYDQPVEVVLEGADHVFWSDDTEGGTFGRIADECLDERPRMGSTSFGSRCNHAASAATVGSAVPSGIKECVCDWPLVRRWF